MKNKSKTKRNPDKQVESYWKIFERNGSIGAFLMFHRTRSIARNAAKASELTKTPPRA